MNLNHATGELRLDKEGREVPDPNPMEIPAGMKRPETLAEQVQRLVRHSISAHAELHGMETFEEADDFDIDEDFDPSTPYEVDFDPVIGREITPADFMNPEKRAFLREEYLKAERNAIRAEERQEAINSAFQASRKKTGRAAGESAPSSEPAKPALAEPQKP